MNWNWRLVDIFYFIFECIIEYQYIDTNNQDLRLHGATDELQMWKNACIHIWVIFIREHNARVNRPWMNSHQYLCWALSGQWIACIECTCWMSQWINCANRIWVRLFGVCAQTTNTIGPISCHRIKPLQSEWVTLLMIWTLDWKQNLNQTYSSENETIESEAYSVSILSVSWNRGSNITFDWNISRWQCDRLSIRIEYDAFHGM